MAGPICSARRSPWRTRCSPPCTRFKTYDVKLDRKCQAYANRILNLPEMIEWTAAALAEPEELEELDVEF